jgi:hypothetical protein
VRAQASALFVSLALALFGAGCRRNATPGAAASASASVAPLPPAPVASGLPGDPLRTSQVVNPKGEPAYDGPSGGVRGTVTISGDPPPTMDALLAKIPDKCAAARQAYAPMFREGLMRSLGDALVAVTGYQGYVPEREPSVTIEAKDCVFSARTVALTYGQSLRLVSRDRDAYVPVLLGSPQPAQLLAMPGGSGTELYPSHPGRFMLSDSIKVFMFADVFVLKYATHAVTGLDGRYEIQGIPSGEVKVSALLPSTGTSAERTVTISAGKTVEVNLELTFDEKKHKSREAGASGAAGSTQRAPGSAASAP